MFPSKFSAAEHFALLAETQKSHALEERDCPFFLEKPKYKWSPTEKMKYRWSSTKNKYVLQLTVIADNLYNFEKVSWNLWTLEYDVSVKIFRRRAFCL